MGFRGQVPPSVGLAQDSAADGQSWKWAQAAGIYVPFTASATTTGFARQRWESDGATTVYTLAQVPQENGAWVTVTGLDRDEQVEYSISYSTGQITFAAPPKAGAVISVRYAVAGGPVPPPAPVTLTDVGTQNSGPGSSFPDWTGYPAWPMTSREIGVRLNGEWSYEAIATDEFVDKGIADAYSTQATVTARPVGPSFFEWEAGFTPLIGSTGVSLQTSNASTSLLLRRRNAIVAQVEGLPVPAAGETWKVDCDFSARVARAYRNGAVISTLDFSAAAYDWYTADGAAA